MASKFRNAGQTCVCANRILVQHEIYDEFAIRLTDAVARQVVGNGMDEGVTIGPLITALPWTRCSGTSTMRRREGRWRPSAARSTHAVDSSCSRPCSRAASRT